MKYKQNKKTNIYLDIDGVILANDLNPAKYAREFVSYVITNYPETTFWLTTHCQGDATGPIKHIGHLFDDKTLRLLEKVKPTVWSNANKTTAIDFSKDFLWFDDDLFHDERQTLIKNGVFDNWIEVNLTKNENQLLDFLRSFPIPISRKGILHEV